MGAAAGSGFVSHWMDLADAPEVRRPGLLSRPRTSPSPRASC